MSAGCGPCHQKLDTLLLFNGCVIYYFISLREEEICGPFKFSLSTDALLTLFCFHSLVHSKFSLHSLRSGATAAHLWGWHKPSSAGRKGSLCRYL